MKPQPMEVLVENEDLKISLLRGGSDVLFVAFTGIGLGVDGIQPEEFVGSIAGIERSAFYVTDRKRSWYNGPGVMDGALRVLR